MKYAIFTLKNDIFFGLNGHRCPFPFFFFMCIPRKLIFIVAMIIFFSDSMIPYFVIISINFCSNNSRISLVPKNITLVTELYKIFHSIHQSVFIHYLTEHSTCLSTTNLVNCVTYLIVAFVVNNPILWKFALIPKHNLSF